MKNVMMFILFSLCFSAKATVCSDKAIFAVKEAVSSGVLACNVSEGKNFKVEQVFLPVSSQSTIFEVSYECEETLGALVAFDDECNGNGTLLLL